MEQQRLPKHLQLNEEEKEAFRDFLLSSANGAVLKYFAMLSYVEEQRVLNESVDTIEDERRLILKHMKLQGIRSFLSEMALSFEKEKQRLLKK